MAESDGVGGGDHSGAEIHVGVGGDDLTAGETTILAIVHCPDCGHVELKFALAHLPGVVAALTSVLQSIAAEIGIEMPDPRKFKPLKTEETTCTLDQARERSLDAYRKRKN